MPPPRRSGKKMDQVPDHRIANPASITLWQKTLDEASDHQIRTWMDRSWSVWRFDMLKLVAIQRGIV